MSNPVHDLERLNHEITRLESLVQSLKLNVSMPGPSLEAARNVVDCAVRIVALVAIKDARDHEAGRR